MKQIIPALILSFICILVAVGIGSVFINPRNVALVLAHKIAHTSLPKSIQPSVVSIIWNLRLPRVLFAFFAGASLSVSGAVMQSVLKNPLASSYTLGISSGASLGAALVILGGVHLPFVTQLGVPIASILCSALSFFAVMGLARAMDAQRSNGTIILTGMVVSLFFSAILTLASAFSRQEMNRLLLWQMGSFALKGWTPLVTLVPVSLIAVFLVTMLSTEMDLLSFGEEQAQSLGLNVKKIRYILIALSSILTGISVAWAGVIGFIDLAVPHGVRKISGPQHKKFIRLCFLYGGIFMVLADLLARTLIPLLDLPVGAITAVLGTPALTFIYFRSRQNGRAV